MWLYTDIGAIHAIVPINNLTQYIYSNNKSGMQDLAAIP